MNRARSGESLSSNGSSSPADFTSDDDDFSSDELVARITQKANNSQIDPKQLLASFGVAEHRKSSNQTNNYNNYNNRVIQAPRLSVYQNTGNSQNIRPNDKAPATFDTLLDNLVDDIILNNPTITNSTSLSNPVSTSSSTTTHYGYKFVENNNRQRRPRLHNSFDYILSKNENIENVVEDQTDSEVVDNRLPFGRMIDGPQLEPISSNLFDSNTNVNPITVRFCSKLVECRTLIEAIEFVEQNRDTIDDLTRIVTRDAPAFRNYDMTNYHIDYTVKESFSAAFWLDREPIVTTADGNCQYHAVSISLTGSELYTPEVRLATAVAVIDNRNWFDSVLKMIDRGTVLDLVHTIARTYSWGDETTLKAIAVAINKRIFLYTCNIGRKDYELVKSLKKDELLDAFREKKYRGGTGIHAYADPLVHVPDNDYIMLFHKSEHFIAVLPTTEHPTMFEPYNPIVPVF